MSWSTKLPRPVALRNGRTLVTLLDAGELIQTQFRRVLQDRALEHLIELLMAAADTGKRGDVAAAAKQLGIVLRIHQLVDLDPETKRPPPAGPGRSKVAGSDKRRAVTRSRLRPPPD